MAYDLPPAPKKYSQQNEQQARRTVEQAFGELFARLTIAEGDIAAGGTPAVGPTAGFTSSASFLVVSFTDASSEGDTPIVSRLWDFGDGTTSTAPNNSTPTHTYPDAGTYTVTLTVTDEADLEDVFTADVVVTEDSAGSQVTFLSWGTEVRDMPAAYSWWNGMQAASMTPSNCVAMLDAFADAGIKCFVRLWRTNFVVDAAGNFQQSLFESELNRYNTTELKAKIAQRCQDGTIITHIIGDDILSDRLWGTTAPLTGAKLDAMAQASRQLFPDLHCTVRARFTQIGSFAFQWLQGVNCQYVFGRGGVSKGSMTQSQWRVADVTAYAVGEEAAQAALPNNVGAGMELTYGLNVVNGGDGTSGIPGDGSPPGQFAIGAAEFPDYAGVLVPRTSRMFTTWQRASDGSTDSYYNTAAIAAAFQDMRDLCDAQ